MAAAVTAPPLAPRPSPRPIAAWSPPRNLVKEARPALKQLQQSAPSSRARRERPCDGCRRRKSKCVLQDSRRCVLCEFHKQECTFVEHAQPRKRKAEDAARPDQLSKKPPPTTHPPALSPPLSTSTSSLSVADSAAYSALSQPSMRKPFAIDDSLSLQRHRHCKYVGQTTALDASLIALGHFDDKNETKLQVGSLRQVASSEYFTTYADSDVQIPDDEARALAEIEQLVGSHSSALVDIYFRHVHPSYPIIHKQAFLDRHQHGDRQFNPPLLAAMYLLALSWWDYEPATASCLMPDVSRLEYIAITSLTTAMQRPKISAVQAGLLLLQRAKSSTWTLTVQLVALGQDIGLHLDCTDWSIPLWERRLRKRLAWALYLQDKWSAVTYGRPSHINAANWNVPPPTADDFEEAPSPPPSDVDAAQLAKGRTIFMEMVALTNIMADVCDTFYSESAKAECARAGQYATQLVLNRAKPVQIKLKDWFARLPAECKMDSSSIGNSSSSSSSAGSSPTAASASASASSSGPSTMQGYLHLAYFAAEISIHRRIVQALDPRGAHDAYLLYICRSAAKTRLISALDFANRLAPAQLRAFWFFASAANFALIGTFGALLQASAPGREEAAFYAARLREFRWTLAVSARHAPWIGAAADLLDASADMLRRLPEKPATTAAAAAASGEVGPADACGVPAATMPIKLLSAEARHEAEGDEDMEGNDWGSDDGGSLSSVSG